MPDPVVRIVAPRKQAASHERVRAKAAAVSQRMGRQNVPTAQIASAVAELAEAIEELRALIERGGGR